MSEPASWKSDPKRDWLTAKEAADLIGVCTQFLYYRVKDKGCDIPYRKRGRSIQFPKERFLKWAGQDIIP